MATAMTMTGTTAGMTPGASPANGSLGTAALAAKLSPIEQELMLLETMKSLMDTATRSLSGGEAEPLLEVNRQVSQTAQDLTALSMQLGRLTWTPEAQEQRRKLLIELNHQRAFCRAMLRRWRRSIALRQQLLQMRGEPVPYTEALRTRLELK